MLNGDTSILATAINMALAQEKAAANAKRCFRRAIVSRGISDCDREEAMYHLAIQFIDEGTAAVSAPTFEAGDRGR